MNASCDLQLPAAPTWKTVAISSAEQGRRRGRTRTYGRGERYYIPGGVPHSGRIFAGYADITFFDEPRRYQAK